MSDETTNETLSSDAGGKISKSKGKRIPTSLKIAGGVAVVVVALVFFLAPDTAPTQGPVSNVSSSAQTTLDATPGGDNQRDNPIYQEEVRRQNERLAAEAAASGQSYIPFPETPLEPIEQVEENVNVEEEVAPEPPQRVVATTVQRTNVPVPAVRRQEPTQAQPQQATQEQAENPFIGIMSEQLVQIAGAHKPRGMTSGTVDLPEQDAAAQGQPGQAGAAQGNVTYTADGRPQPVVDLGGQRIVRSDTGGRTASNGGANALVRDAGASQDSVAAREAGEVAPEDQRGEVLIKAGDILYARIIGGVSSDYTSPVIAEILNGGTNKKARLVGSYAVDKSTGRMVVGFKQMSWDDGTARTIEALAVDENTGETAVRSGIERRYMARYAPIFASTFVAGLADAAGDAETTIVDSGSGQYAVEASRTMEEAAWSGLGDAMSVISSDIISNAPKGPKIILASGSTIGVMFTQDLREGEE